MTTDMHQHPLTALTAGGAVAELEAMLAEFCSTVSDVCPGDPPTKIVSRHLGPYLTNADRTAVRA